MHAMWAATISTRISPAALGGRLEPGPRGRAARYRVFRQPDSRFNRRQRRDPISAMIRSTAPILNSRSTFARPPSNRTIPSTAGTVNYAMSSSLKSPTAMSAESVPRHGTSC